MRAGRGSASANADGAGLMPGYRRANGQTGKRQTFRGKGKEWAMENGSNGGNGIRGRLEILEKKERQQPE